MLLGGFFTNSGKLAKWLKVVEKVSPLRYGFEALGWNYYGDAYKTGKVNCTVFNPKNPNYVEECMPHFLGFKMSYWECLWIMIGMSIVLRIISVIGMKLVIGKFSQ